MTYQLLEQYSIDFTGPPMVPKGFAIHWWGDPLQKPTFYGTVNVLLERGRQQSASVNFVAEAGIVACLISPNTVAWAQGDGGTGWGNLNLISIECNPRCTAADRETVAELMADQHIINGVPLVAYPHNNFTATLCPGVWEQYIPWLVSRAKQIVAAKQNPVTPASSAPPVVKKESEMPSYKRLATPTNHRRLAKDQPWFLKDKTGKVNENYFVHGAGYYDIKLHLQGTDLPTGQFLTVNFFLIPPGGKPSGYYTQRIVGAADGKFKDTKVFGMAVPANHRIEASITSSIESAYIDVYGADVATWKA